MTKFYDAETNARFRHSAEAPIYLTPFELHPVLERLAEIANGLAEDDPRKVDVNAAIDHVEFSYYTGLDAPRCCWLRRGEIQLVRLRLAPLMLAISDKPDLFIADADAAGVALGIIQQNPPGLGDFLIAGQQEDRPALWDRVSDEFARACADCGLAEDPAGRRHSLLDISASAVVLKLLTGAGDWARVRPVCRASRLSEAEINLLVEEVNHVALQELRHENS